jgi:hypothetical protein
MTSQGYTLLDIPGGGGERGDGVFSNHTAYVQPANDNSRWAIERRRRGAQPGPRAPGWRRAERGLPRGRPSAGELLQRHSHS